MAINVNEVVDYVFDDLPSKRREEIEEELPRNEELRAMISVLSGFADDDFIEPIQEHEPTSSAQQGVSKKTARSFWFRTAAVLSSIAALMLISAIGGWQLGRDPGNAKVEPDLRTALLPAVPKPMVFMSADTASVQVDAEGKFRVSSFFQFRFTSPRTGYAMVIRQSENSTEIWPRTKSIACKAQVQTDIGRFGPPTSTERFVIVVTELAEDIEGIRSLFQNGVGRVDDVIGAVESYHRKASRSWVGISEVFHVHGSATRPVAWQNVDNEFDELDGKDALKANAAQAPKQDRLKDFLHLNAKGEKAFRLRQFDEAAKVFGEAVKFAESLFDPNDYRLAGIYANLGISLMKLHRLEDAEKYCSQAVKIDRANAKSERDKKNLAMSLNNLGNLHLRTAPVLAVDDLEEALTLLREVSPKSDANVVGCMQNLGDARKRIGMTFSARVIIEEALKTARQLNAQRPATVSEESIARIISNLGSVHYLDWRLDEARSCLEEALAIRKRINSPYYAISLNGLASILYSQGEEAQALQRFLQVAEMREAGEKSHRDPELANTYENICRVHTRLRDFDEADRAFQKAADIRREIGRNDPASLVAMHFSRAQLDLARGDNAKALDSFEKVLHHHAKTSGGQPTLSLATTKNDIGQILHRLGKRDEALERSSESVAMFRQLYKAEKYPDGHPYLARAIENHGLYQLANDDTFDVSVQTLMESARMFISSSEQQLTGLSESEALNYAALHLRPQNELITNWRATELSDDELYEYVWRFKGILCRILYSRNRWLEQNSDVVIRENYQRWHDLRRSLAKTAYSASSRTRLVELQNQKEELERLLAQSIPTFRRRLSVGKRAHQDLTNALPRDTAYVDFLHFVKVAENQNQLNQRSYCAFVIQHGQPVVMVPLDLARPIENDILQWRSDIRRGVRSDAAQRLRESVWIPIERTFEKDVSKIVICPDGKLATIPWLALPSGADRKYLIHQYRISTFANGHLLLDMLETAPSDERGMFLEIGKVAYGPGESLTLPKESNVRLGAGKIWTNLKHTAIDPSNLGKIARHETLYGKEATTSNVIRMLPKARWAHFATHGFFADAEIQSLLDLDEKEFRVPMFASPERRLTTAARSPLILSGIVLANANQPRNSGGHTNVREDETMLLADMIAGMPLSSLHLVGLWACDSGIGDVAAGEGVFNLQRAFHLAGARTVVASLWKVEENATAQLMNAFYHNLFVKNMTKVDALRDAQLDLIDEFPFFWAAWSLSGETE